MGKKKQRDKKQAVPAPTQAERAPFRLKAWHVLLGLAVAAVALLEAYQPALDGPFLFDDRYLPFGNAQDQGAPLAVWVRGLRPLLMLTYWVNYQISGEAPYLYHLVNALFHLLGGLMVFLIVRRLLERAAIDVWPRELAAAFAAGVFLLHPLHTEAVAYVASRSENLSVMLAYAAFTVFLYRPVDGGVSWPRALAVVVLFGMAAATKEHAVVMPALLLVTDYYFFPGFSFQGIRKNWKLYAPIAAAGAVGMWFVWGVLSRTQSAGFSLEGMPWYRYFLTQCKAIWIYVRMFLLPYGQSADHDYPAVTSITDPLAIAGMVALAGMAAAAWWFRKKAPLVSYGYFVFLIMLAPTSSIVPIQDTLVERRVYLASLGLLIIVADLVCRWRAPRRVTAGAMAVLLVVLAVRTHARAEVWSSNVLLWEDTVAQYPDSWRANFQLAYAYFDANRCLEAVESYARAAELEDKPDYRLLVDWALAYDCAGRLGEAEQKLEEAAELRPSAHVYAQLGMMQAKQGRYDEALESLAEAEKEDARFSTTYEYRGNVYLARGEPALAAPEFQRAIELDPSNEVAHRGLQRAQQAVLQGR